MAYEIRDGKVRASTFKIDVVDHCNLSCRACEHASPVRPRACVDPQRVERDLAILGRYYHAEFVRLLGGEPLLHPDLAGVVEAIRRVGIAERIVLVTNGVLLPKMPARIWEAIDAVEISQYPGKGLTADETRECRAKAKAAGVALYSYRISTFRESYSEVGTTDAALVRRIYETCDFVHLWKCNAVLDGYFYKCMRPHALAKLQTGSDEGAHADGLRIEADPAFAEKLLAYLESPEPLAACSKCLGTAGKTFPHQQVKRVAFRDGAKRPTEELLDRRLLIPGISARRVVRRMAEAQAELRAGQRPRLGLSRRLS